MDGMGFLVVRPFLPTQEERALLMPNEDFLKQPAGYERIFLICRRFRVEQNAYKIESNQKKREQLTCFVQNEIVGFILLTTSSMNHDELMLN
jgi:hypothetical protein